MVKKCNNNNNNYHHIAIFCCFIISCESQCTNNSYCNTKYYHPANVIPPANDYCSVNNECGASGAVGGSPTCCINGFTSNGVFNVSCEMNAYCYCICATNPISASEVGDPHFTGFRGQMMDPKLQKQKEAYVSILEDCVLPLRINQYWFTHVFPNTGGVGEGGQWIETTFVRFEEKERKITTNSGSKQRCSDSSLSFIWSSG